MADPSLGPFDPNQVQIHDVNPGDLNVPGLPNHFPDGGIFWTRDIPRTAKIGSGGNVAYEVTNIALLDYFDVVNAIFRNGPPPIRSRADVRVRWRDSGERRVINNDAAGFNGVYHSTDVLIDFGFVNADGYFFNTLDSSHRLVTSSLVSYVEVGAFHS